MGRGDLFSAVVVDAHGRPLASAGAAENPPKLEGPGIERAPLPGGGHLVTETANADEAWSRFSRAFIHEVRSPLNALGIYLDLLGTRLKDGSPSENTDPTPQRIFAKANDQIRRIEELLVAFGELWGATGEETDFAEMVRAACRFAEHEALRSGIAMSCEICEHASLTAPPWSLAEGVVLLLAGAMKGPADGKVHMSLKPVRAHEVELHISLAAASGPEADALRPGALRLQAAGARIQIGQHHVTATFELARPRPGTDS